MMVLVELVCFPWNLWWFGGTRVFQVEIDDVFMELMVLDCELDDALVELVCSWNLIMF